MLASTKSSASVKFRTAKFSSEGLDGKSAKSCTGKIFHLYGNKKSDMLYDHADDVLLNQCWVITKNAIMVIVMIYPMVITIIYLIVWSNYSFT